MGTLVAFCIVEAITSFGIAYAIALYGFRFILDGYAIIWFFFLAWLIIGILVRDVQERRKTQRQQHLAQQARIAVEADKKVVALGGQLTNNAAALESREGTISDLTGQISILGGQVSTLQKQLSESQDEAHLLKRQLAVHEITARFRSTTNRNPDQTCQAPTPARPKVNIRKHLDYLIERQNVICGIPRILGGSDDPDNLQVTHAQCNLSKGDGLR